MAISSIKEFLQKSINYLIILVIILIFISSGVIYLFYDNFNQTVEQTFTLSYNLLDSFLIKNERLLKTASTLPDAMSKEEFFANRDLRSLYVLDQDGRVQYAYPEQNLTGISLSGMNIYQSLQGEDELVLQILPYVIGDDQALLAMGLEEAGQKYIGIFSFNRVFSQMEGLRNFNVFSNGEKNLVLTNRMQDIEHADIESENTYFGNLFKGFRKKSIFLERSGLEFTLIYDLRLSGYIVTIFIIFILILLATLYYIYQNIKASYNEILGDLELLDNLSTDFSEMLQQNSLESEYINHLPVDLDQLENKLNAKSVKSTEIKRVFNSYQTLFRKLFILLEEISSQNEEIRAMKDEVEASFEEIAYSQGRLEVIFDFMSRIDPEDSLADFMEEALDILIEMVPDAEGGSIGIIKDGFFHFLAQRGYDDILKEVDFPTEVVFLSEEPVIIRNVHQEYHQDMDEKYIKIFNKAGSPNIKASLAMGLKTNKIIGNVFVDSFSDGNAFSPDDKSILEAFSRFMSLYTYLQKSIKRLDNTNISIIKSLAKAMEIKDNYTIGHSERVAFYSRKLANLVGFDKKRLDKIYQAGLLHDIGKIGISDTILNKPSSLTDDEYETIKLHALFGGSVLEEVEYLENISDIVKYHHERWDGKGYPQGLAANNIPVESRIIAIFDAFDTILSARSYKTAKSFSEAITELEKNAGSQFDPELIKVLLDHIDKKWLELEEDLG